MKFKNEFWSLQSQNLYIINTVRALGRKKKGPRYPRCKQQYICQAILSHATVTLLTDKSRKEYKTRQYREHKEHLGSVKTHYLHALAVFLVSNKGKHWKY